MSSLEHDIETLDNAVSLFAQTMRRPQRWASVTSRAKINIDRPSAVILHLLLQNEDSLCHVQSLAAQLGIEPPSVTRKTQELEHAGYLRRVPDPADRRVIDLRVTGRGRSLAKRLWKAQRAVLAETLNDWNPADRRQFVKLFDRFSNDLSAAPGKANRPLRHGAARV